MDKYQLLPPLPPEQFAALKADIAERGVVVPVIVDEFGEIIDGHNRVRAARELCLNYYPTEVRSGLSEDEKRALSRKLNALRRHLTREQMRQVVADQIKETPDWANSRLASALGVDDKTVALVRTHLEATSEIPRLMKLTGADGKARPRNQPKAKRPATDHDDDLDDDLDDDDDDLGPPSKKKKPQYTEKEMEDLWAGKGALAAMKRNAMERALALMDEGMPADNPIVMALIKDASILPPITIETPGYDPLFGRSDAERLEWHLFMLFLSYDGAAGRAGGDPVGVSNHVEWICRGSEFQCVADWLGEKGDKVRHTWSRTPKHNGRGIEWEEPKDNKHQTSDKFKADWAAFLDQHRDWTLPAVIEKLQQLEIEFEQVRQAHASRKQKRKSR